MPVELGLELVAVVSFYFPDPEREFLDDLVDKIDGIGLGMALVDFQSPHAGCIINCRILESADLFALLSFECQKLNIHLDMVTRYLLVIAFGMNLSHPGAARKAVHAVSFQYSRYGRIRYLDVVVALQIPNNSDRAEMVLVGPL